MAFPKIEGYVVVEKLGSGSYSTVYKAFTKTGARDVVAIKCIEKSLMKGSAVDNLITEIRLLKTLKHQHIVLMKDFQWDDRYIYIVMEYCNAGDLSHHLKRKGGIPERVCRQLLRQLASALQQLRERGIVHMDLKPQNLLLDKPTPAEMILKIADFGFAQYMSEETRMNSMRGSPLYMAPEVFATLGKKDSGAGYDAKVDLWSVGVILYECLFGRAPYSSNSFKELMGKIQSRQKIELPLNSSISQECEDLLTGLLQHDPERRMSYDDFFHHEFLDMAHMPSAEHYKKAVELVKKAIEFDTCGDYERAYHLYCESLRYFVPMVTEETNRAKKNALRSKVNCYIRRAEHLKIFTTCGVMHYPKTIEQTADGANRTKDGNRSEAESDVIVIDGKSSVSYSKNSNQRKGVGSGSTAIESSNAVSSDRTRNVSSRSDEDRTVSVCEHDSSACDTGIREEMPIAVHLDSKTVDEYLAASKRNFDKLYNLCSSTSVLKVGLEAGITAEMYVQEGRNNDALKLYSSALATLLKASSTEPPGVRRMMLADKIKEWLQEAESLKALQETLKMEAEESTDDSSAWETCCLQ